MFKYIIPVWLTMSVSSFLGITDFYFLKTISDDYFTVLGVAYIPFTIISCLLVGFGVECHRRVVVDGEINLTEAILLPLIVTILIIIPSYIFADKILAFYPDEKYHNDAINYFHILLISIIPMVILFVGNGVLRGLGKTLIPVVFGLLIIVLNFTFDYIFFEIIKVEDPVAGCVYDSLSADSIVAFLYILYLKKYQQPFAKIGKNVKSFLKSSSWCSLEKLLSTGALMIFSEIFIARLPIADSNIYFAYSVFLMPAILLSHAYFEWVLHVHAKGEYKDHSHIHATIFVAFLLSSFFMYIYLQSPGDGTLSYAFWYSIFLFLFWIERGYVALYFANRQDSFPIKVLAAQKIFYFVILALLYYYGYLNLANYIAITVALSLGQNLVLKQKLPTLNVLQTGEQGYARLQFNAGCCC